jgi:GTP-binding protein
MIVAIVGRPNVGKSTLFNRLVGRPAAIVHDRPGVTRDRQYADAELSGHRVTLVDTGGFDPASEDPMQQGIARQVRAALAEADLVVAVLDAGAPPTSVDTDEVALLRRSGRAVLYVANKCDDAAAELAAQELYRLGMERLWCVSARNGRGLDALEDAIVAALSLPSVPVPASSGEGGPLRIAVVGRPNAGKSSLVNRLLGAERLLVDARPGTTRDPIDTLVTRRGRQYLFVDTAGLRRKASVARGADAVEALAVMRAIRALDRAEIAVLVCDAVAGVAEQDAKILALAVERGRAVVVGFNKIDLLEARALALAERRARDELAFATWAPIVRLSATTGRGVDKLLATVERAAHAWRERVPTAELNRFFAEVLAHHPPPTHAGRAPRLYYVTQAETAPPTFIVAASHPGALAQSYRRYVVNAIRRRFGFEGTPVRVFYKGRRRREHRAETG